jgi:hypothetical protein
MEKEIVAKNTVHAFKKFLRDKKQWERYKRSSVPLNGYDRFGEWLKPISFKELVTQCEPVELIQSSRFFCTWSGGSSIIWHPLSKEWARYCLKNGLYYDIDKALEYVRSFISAVIVADFMDELKK